MYLLCPTKGTSSWPSGALMLFARPHHPWKSSFLLGLWCATVSHPPHGHSSYHSQALIPHAGLSWLLLYPPGQLPSSVPPSDFKTTLIRKEEKSKKGRKGRTLYLILLYISYKGLWFCYFSFSQSFYKVIQGVLKTAPLSLFWWLLSIVFSFSLLFPPPPLKYK